MCGFSLLETMVSVLLMSMIMAAALSQVEQAQQRNRIEPAKLDIFQESRDFMDQLARDVHQTGYPSIRMFDTSSFTPALASPSASDSRIAVGIIKITASELQFEGNVDGDGQVDVMDYKLQSTGNNCPCLERSQILKSTGVTVFSNEVQNVQNAGTSSDPLFVGYTASGASITAADMTTTTGQQSLASIKTVQVTLKVKAPTVDPQTGLAPETSLGGMVTIGNCSLAATGQANSCS
jgi:type II secretory pathway component PulJ